MHESENEIYVRNFFEQLRTFLNAYYDKKSRRTLIENLIRFSRSRDYSFSKTHLDYLMGPKKKNWDKVINGAHIIREFLGRLGCEFTENGISPPNRPDGWQNSFDALSGINSVIFDAGYKDQNRPLYGKRAISFPSDSRMFEQSGNYRRYHQDNPNTGYDGRANYILAGKKPSYMILNLTEKLLFSESSLFDPIGTYYLKEKQSEKYMFKFWYGLGLGLKEIDSDLIIAAPALILPEEYFPVYAYKSIGPRMADAVPNGWGIYNSFVTFFEKMAEPYNGNCLKVLDTKDDKIFVEKVEAIYENCNRHIL